MNHPGCREDVLQWAWYTVHRTNGTPGIDKITLVDVEEYGVAWLPAATRASCGSPGASRGPFLQLCNEFFAECPHRLITHHRLWQRGSGGRACLPPVRIGHKA